MYASYADGKFIVQPKSSFFSSLTTWKNCCIGVINDSVKLSFNDIRTLTIEEFSCVGFIDVFQHDLGFMVFNFDNHRNLLRAIAKGFMFIECAKPAFEVFFKSWNEKLYTSKSDTVKVWLRLTKTPYTY